MHGEGGGGVAIGMEGECMRSMPGANIGYRETACPWLIETVSLSRSNEVDVRSGSLARLGSCLVSTSSRMIENNWPLFLVHTFESPEHR